MERTERPTMRVTAMRPREAWHADDHARQYPDVPVWDVMDIPASTIEALRGEVEALRARLSQAAPRRAVLEMDKAISLLNRRVEDIREAGTDRDGRNEALLKELADLRAAVGGIARPERLRALESGVEAVSRKIDLMGSRAVDPVDVARLHGQLSELTEMVGRATANSAAPALQKVAERLAACAEEVTRAGEDTAQRLAEATGRFERNTAALLDRVEHLQARAMAGDPAATENLKTSLLGMLETVHERLDQMSDQVARQVSALSPAVGAELAQRLDGLLHRIAAAEEAGKVAVGPLADVVERHLLVLTEQFRDTHARLGRLDTIESALQRMEEEMRQVRDSAHSATSEAVRAVSEKVSTAPDGSAVVGLKRGLAALEARQDEIERRASEILVTDLELELNSIATALDREGDGTFAPRSHTVRTAAEAAAAAPEPAQAASSPPPRAAAHVAPAPEPRQSTTQWPRASRRVVLGKAEADETRPRVGDRKGRRQEARQDGRSETRATFSGFFTRHRHVAMVALIAGATTVFAGTVAAYAWRNGPELVSSITAAAQRRAAPAVAGVSGGTELPAPLGTPALQNAARAGDPAAAFAVGSRYVDDGALESAVKWYVFAMENGSAPAAHRLGALYEAGGRDLGEARRFYERAAQQGNVRAMHALAMLLSDGRTSGAGGKPDWDGAMKWFRAAAEQGHRDSQYNLGVIYARGLGVMADLGAAWKWLSLAAAQGDEDSAGKRDIIARDIDAGALAQAKQAMATFVPRTQDPAANTVELRPEWGEGDGGQVVAGSKGTQLAAAPIDIPQMTPVPASVPQAAKAAVAKPAPRTPTAK